MKNYEQISEIHIKYLYGKYRAAIEVKLNRMEVS